MKFYLSSSFLNKENARQATNMIENAGHTLTYDWTTHPDTTDLTVFEREAIEDLQGVKDADILIYLHPGRRGSSAELGAALALGKPVIMVGGISRLDSVFFNHPLVRVVGTVSDAIAVMRSLLLNHHSERQWERWYA